MLKRLTLSAGAALSLAACTTATAEEAGGTRSTSDGWRIVV